jgi:hypothetical protein
MNRYLFLSDSYVLVSVGRPLWREDGSVFCICRWLLPAQSFSGPSPLGLSTVFYCLRFETSHLVAFYDSQGHGGSIRPRLHTGFSQSVPLIRTRDRPHGKHIFHCCSSIVAMGTCLFAKSLLCNCSCIVAYHAVVAQQQVYMLIIVLFRSGDMVVW